MKKIALILVSLSLAACTQAPLLPTAGDKIPERALDQNAIQNTFDAKGAWKVSSFLEAPEGATRLGVLLTLKEGTPSSQSIRLVAKTIEGQSVPVHYTWAEHPMRTGFAEFDATTAVELWVHSDDVEHIQSLVFSAVVPEPQVQEAEFDMAASQPMAAANVTQNALAISNVVSRAEWGARATRCTSRNAQKSRITVHHTVSPSAPQPAFENNLRGIQAYHMDSRGWCDVGYHFLVTRDGRAWEARDATLMGAHVGGQNTNNLGISMIGCFHTSGCEGLGATTPPTVMTDRVASLIAQNADHYGINISSSTVMGHRDNPGQSTSCPGNNVHSQLDSIRALATSGESGGNNGGEEEPTLGQVRGIVWDLSVTADPQNAPELNATLAGAQITCGDCGEQTVTRENDAFWSIDVPPGTYTFTASVEGYAVGQRSVQVTSGGDHWASMGVAPEDESASLTLFIIDNDTGAALHNAQAQVSGSGVEYSESDGSVRFEVNAGAVLVTVGAEGYLPEQDTVFPAAGDDFRHTMRLTRRAADVPEDDTPGDDTPGDDTPGDDTPGDDNPNNEPPEGEPPYQEQGDIEDGAPEQTPGEGTVRIQSDGGMNQALCECISGDSDASEPTFALLALFGLVALGKGRKRSS